MVKKRPIPFSYYRDPCSEKPLIIWETTETTPLFLVYTTSKPYQTPIWKTVRGVTRLCGQKMNVGPTVCIKQKPPSDSTIHAWELPSYPVGTTLWYVISSSCNFAVGPNYTPVLKYVYPDCATNQYFASVGITGYNVIASDFDVFHQYFRGGNQSMWINPPAYDLKPNAPGEYHAYAIQEIRIDHNAPGSATYRMTISDRASPENIIAEDTHSGGQGERLSFLATGTKNLPANSAIHIHFTRTAGTNLCEWISQEHDGIFTVSVGDLLPF